MTFSVSYVTISCDVQFRKHTESYRSGHNGADSKHSRVCHDRISVNPLFIGVFVTSVCTFENLHLAVFSQFGKSALPLQFHMETYRSGHNGADSKSVREQSPASSNLAVSANRKEIIPRGMISFFIVCKAEFNQFVFRTDCLQ